MTAPPQIKTSSVREEEMREFGVPSQQELSARAPSLLNSEKRNKG